MMGWRALQGSFYFDFDRKKIARDRAVLARSLTGSHRPLGHRRFLPAAPKDRRASLISVDVKLEFKTASYEGVK